VGSKDSAAVAATDPIVESVLARVRNRSEQGLKKYGVTMLRDDVSTIEWLRHAQEEALDFAVYIERIIYDLKQRELRSLEENKKND